MIQFVRDLSINPLLGYGLIAGALASLSCGAIGPHVLTRRLVFLAGAIAHVVLGGLGAVVFLRHHFPSAMGWLRPLHGAVASALVASVVIGLVHARGRERLDTLIGALWAVGMTAGIVLIKYTDGYQTELLSFLLGNISAVSPNDLIFTAILVGIILVSLALLHKQLLAVAVDEEYAALQGVNVTAVNIALLALVSLAVVTLLQVVGLILVIALLTLPAATAAHHTTRIETMMLVSTLLCLGLTTLPRAAAYGSALPPEAAIVFAAAGTYLVSALFARRRDGVPPLAVRGKFLP